jgi:hypothetical protein
LHWTSKILQLEQLEDKAVDDATKRLWLTATLSTKLHMATCLTQAKVTEMTQLGMSSTSSKQMPWDSFYNLILAHAKRLDHSHASTPKTKRDANIGRGGGYGGRVGRGAGRGYPAPGCGSDTYSRPPWADFVYTTVTGPNMVIKSNMIFKPEEWIKLTPAQKSKLRAARKMTLKPTPAPVPAQPAQPALQIHATALQANNVAPSPNVPAPTESHLRQVLSNRTVHTSNADSNQVTFNGQTYQRITNTVIVSYQLHHAACRIHHGSLIDSGCKPWNEWL